MKLNEEKNPSGASEQSPRPAQHTPGPWYVTPGNDYYVDADFTPRDKGVIDFNLAPETICEVGNSPDDLGEANAHLIAAAPALLEACRSALAAGYHSESTLEKLERALALAEGNEPERDAERRLRPHGRRSGVSL